MKKYTTNELVNLLTSAINVGDQNLINMYAYELTTRLYVPNEKYTFEETLEGFGFRKIENQIEGQITLEEYMEGLENERSRKRS